MQVVNFVDKLEDSRLDKSDLCTPTIDVSLRLGLRSKLPACFDDRITLCQRGYVKKHHYSMQLLSPLNPIPYSQFESTSECTDSKGELPFQ